MVVVGRRRTRKLISGDTKGIHEALFHRGFYCLAGTHRRIIEEIDVWKRQSESSTNIYTQTRIRDWENSDLRKYGNGENRRIEVEGRKMLLLL